MYNILNKFFVGIRISEFNNNLILKILLINTYWSLLFLVDFIDYMLLYLLPVCLSANDITLVAIVFAYMYICMYIYTFYLNSDVWSYIHLSKKNPSIISQFWGNTKRHFSEKGQFWLAIVMLLQNIKRNEKIIFSYCVVRTLWL